MPYEYSTGPHATHLERRSRSLTRVSIPPLPDAPGLSRAASHALLICLHSLNNPVNYIDPSGHCVLLPPFDTAACAIAAGASVSAGTVAGIAAAATALTVVVTDAVSPDFNPIADLANLIGDVAGDAQRISQEIMKNLAGPSASGNPNDLEPQDPKKGNEPEQLKSGKSAHQRLGREYLDSVPEEQRSMVDIDRTFIDKQGRNFRPDVVNHATGEIIEFKPASWATNPNLRAAAERQATSYANRLNHLYRDSRALDGLPEYTYRIEYYP